MAFPGKEPVSVLDNYIAILVLGVVSILIPLLAIFVGHRLGPRRPNPQKAQPYESGMTAIGPAQRRVPVKFYRIAVLFILFDIEIIFMYPWAVLFLNIGRKTFLFIEMLIFVVILFIGYLYAWKTGALEWD
jgi:NADH-quinone oxidoreductase subunit A